jgi:predicted site-specific integrase-resolvase
LATSTNPILSGYVTKKQLAEALGVSERTLDRWAAEGKGAARTQPSKTVYYSREHVKEWLESHTRRMPREARREV